MKDSTIFASALLIAGAILAGFSLLAASDYGVILGFGIMLVGVLTKLNVGKWLVDYLASFSEGDRSKESRESKEKKESKS